MDAAAYRFFQVGCRIHWFLNLNPSGAAPKIAWWAGQGCLVGRMVFHGARRRGAGGGGAAAGRAEELSPDEGEGHFLDG